MLGKRCKSQAFLPPFFLAELFHRTRSIFYLACKLALVSLFVFILFLPLDPTTHLPHLPLSPLQIVVLEIFMDLGASATFVAEAGEATIVTRRPSDTRNIFDRVLVGDIIRGGAVLFMAVAGAWAIGWRMAKTGGPDQDERENAARTFTFLGWLIGHVVLAGTLRSRDVPLRIHGMFGNRTYTTWAGCVVVFACMCLVPQVAHALKLVGYDRMSPGGVAIVAALAVCGVGGVLEVWKEVHWCMMKRRVGLDEENLNIVIIPNIQNE